MFDRLEIGLMLNLNLGFVPMLGAGLAQQGEQLAFMDSQIDLIEDLQFPATANRESFCNIAQLGDHRSFESID